MAIRNNSADLDVDSEQVRSLVLANKILYRQKIVDGFGHVSVRREGHPGEFLLSRSKAPSLITKHDILVHDLEGEAPNAAGAGLYLERYIHSEIYRSRPDVDAVVHCHSEGALLFGVTGQRFRPVAHTAGFLGSGSAEFEISNYGGDTNMLIVNKSLGVALAEQLGDSACVLMRGHGMTVVGGSLQEVVYRAIYAESNAHLQLKASALGPIRFLSEGEARMTTQTIGKSISRAWELWCAEAI